MKRSAVVFFALGFVFPIAVYADSDVSGHPHAGTTDHHTMHDQMPDKPWEFYGALYMALQYNSAGNAKSHSGKSAEENFYLTSEGTTVGFRGAFPLEGNLKAVWQVESTISLEEVSTTCGHAHGTQPSNCNDSVLAGGHNTFLGLSGDFGTLLVGKHNTPFFDSTIQFDLFHHLPGDVRGLLGSVPGITSGTGDHHASTFNASAPDMIMYKSQNLSGFSFEAAIFGFNETLEKSDKKSAAFGIGARYEQPMFTLVAAFEQHKNYDMAEYEADLLDETVTPAVPGTDGVMEEYTAMVNTTTGLVLGGMLHLNEGNTMVGAFIERLSADDPVVTDDSRTGYYVNFQQRFMGKNKFKAVLAMANEFAKNDAATMLAIAYARELGTGTEAHVIYASTRNDKEASYSNGIVGPLGHGGDPSTVAVGLVHKF